MEILIFRLGVDCGGFINAVNAGNIYPPYPVKLFNNQHY